MKTRDELISDVRSHVNELTPRFWEDAELIRWSEEALRDIARRAEILRDIKTYTTVVDQVTYDAPEDMTRIHRVEYRQSTDYIVPLEYKPFNEMDAYWWTSRNVSGSTPCFWSWWGYPSQSDRSQIYVYPSCSSQITDGLAVFYHRLPQPLLEGKTPAEVPSGWEDLVPLYCEMVARRKDNDQRWREAQELYEARLEQFISLTRHPTDQSYGMTSAGPWPATFGWSDPWAW